MKIENFVPDNFNEKELKNRCRTKWLGQTVLFYEQLDSTNTKAKELALNGAEHGTCVIADSQTAGRGRRGKTFESLAGQGIFMTLLLKPDINPNHVSRLTLVAALAVEKAIMKVTGVQAQIKWPNDIIIGNKKVCGILTEMIFLPDNTNAVLVGIGMNVHNEKFCAELENMATSLFLETKQHISRMELTALVWEFFEHDYEIFLETEDLSNLLTEYETYLVNREKEVMVLDLKKPFCGTAKGIMPTGELIVDTTEGRKLISAGEVSVRGIYGYI